MSLRRASGAALFLWALFLQAGCAVNDEALLPSAAAPAAPAPAPHFSRPRELGPDQGAELCQAAAEELEKQGLNADAVAQYEKARRLDPKRGPALAHRLALLYDRLGDDAHALADYKRALAVAPQDADLLNDVGYFHYQRGDLAKAETYFRQALDANHSHLRAAVNLGLTLGKEGKADSSLEAFRQVLPASEAYCNVGVLLAQQGKAAEARRSLEEALHLEPGLKQARLVLDHLDDIAAAAPQPSRPTSAVAPPPPPAIQQATAPISAPATRQASYTAGASTPHRDTAVPVTPLPAHPEIAAAPPLPVRATVIPAWLPPIPREAALPAAAPLPTATISSVQPAE